MRQRAFASGAGGLAQAGAPSLQADAWSRYPLYLRSQRPEWLRVDRLLGEGRIPQDSVAGRQQFAIQMEARRASEATGEYSGLPRGWCRGREEFRQELLLQMVRLSEPKFGGPEWPATSEQKAEQLLDQELKRRGWEEQTLAQRLKADPEKLQRAERLRGETTMTWSWIAQRLRMGSPGYVANCRRQRRR